jgi:cytoskeletal protein RodZ
MIGREDDQPDSHAGGETLSVGPRLKEARIAKGLTLDSAAAASKVPPSLVRLMEEQQFDLVPDPLYILRFLSEYARFLGLDPKEIERQFRRQVQPVPTGAPLRPVGPTRRAPRLGRLFLYLASAGALIPLAFIVLSLLSGRPAEPPADRAAAPPPPQELPQARPPADQMASPGPVPTTPGRSRQAGVSPSRDAAPGMARVPRDRSARYTLRAEAAALTWLAVAADGAPRREVMLQPGNTAQWSATEGFVVSVGNPEGIRLFLNDKPVPLPAGARVVQGLVLPADREGQGPR